MADKRGGAGASRSAGKRGGVPDTLVLGLLAVVVGGSASVWLATEVGGVLEHGAVPDVGYTGSIAAVRHLVGDPHDIGGAWPSARAGTLPSAPLFYLVLIILLALLAWLALWLATWRARRSAARRGRSGRARPPRARAAAPVAAGGPVEEAWPEPAAPEGGAPGVPTADTAAAAAPAVAADGVAGPAELRAALSARAVLARAGRVRPDLPAPVRDPQAVGLALGAEVRTGTALYGALDDSYLVVGPPRSGKGTHVVIPAVRAAPGPVVVVSSSVDVLRETAAARAAAGPVGVFDPLGLATGMVAGGTAGPGSPLARSAAEAGMRSLRWAPQRGCEDAVTAAARARTFIGGAARGDGTRVTEAAGAVLACYLHAAALDGAGIDRVLYWAANPDDDEPIAQLEAAGWAAEGWSGDLAAQVAAPPGFRGEVWRLVRAALAPLGDARTLHACSPSRGDLLDAAALARQCGTLYVLTADDEGPGLAPLTAALVGDVLARCRAEARRLPAGRLAPPLLLVLDGAAASAPLPDLPELMASAGTNGIAVLATLRSLDQAVGRWGADAAERLWQTASIRLVLGGTAAVERGGVAGDAAARIRAAVRGAARPGTPAAAGVPAALEELPAGTAAVLHHQIPAVVTRLVPYWAETSGGGLRARLTRRGPSA